MLFMKCNLSKHQCCLSKVEGGDVSSGVARFSLD